jgi:hypothetical protein
MTVQILTKNKGYYLIMRLFLGDSHQSEGIAVVQSEFPRKNTHH